MTRKIFLVEKKSHMWRMSNGPKSRALTHHFWKDAQGESITGRLEENLEAMWEPWSLILRYRLPPAQWEGMWQLISDVCHGA